MGSGQSRPMRASSSAEIHLGGRMLRVPSTVNETCYSGMTAATITDVRIPLPKIPHALPPNMGEVCSDLMRAPSSASQDPVEAGVMSRDSTRGTSQRRVITVPVDRGQYTVNWVTTMQITAESIASAGLERTRVRVLVAELAMEKRESALFIEMTKPEIFNVETMAVEGHDVKVNTIPMYVLKVIALSIKGSGQQKACEEVFEQWQKCTMFLENNLTGPFKDIAKEKINVRMEVHAMESSYKISKLFFDYSHCLMSNRTDCKIKNIKTWLMRDLCKDVNSIIENVIALQGKEVAKINKQDMVDIQKSKQQAKAATTETSTQTDE